MTPSHLSHNDTAVGSHRRHSAKRRLKVVWLVITAVEALVTVAAAFGGYVNPKVSTIPALLAMTLPGWFILTAIFTIVNLFIDKRLAIATAVVLVLSLPAWWNFFPMNVFHPDFNDAPDDCRLRFMTYNTLGYIDFQGIYPLSTNRTASAIINSGADIVCLQEVGYIDVMPANSVYKAQIDSLTDVYPYFAEGKTLFVAVLSKYPLREIELPQFDAPYVGWQGVEVDFHGRKLLVVSVHLQSIGLTDDDKLIYHEITDGENTSEWSHAMPRLYHKLSSAFVDRALQAQMLKNQIDSLGYENVIVAGDFNDTPGSYAERTLRSAGLRSAFADAAFGPCISYHANRFYFNIDHVLYRGDMSAASYRLGRIRSSDHYPVFVNFLFTKQDKQ